MISDPQFSCVIVPAIFAFLFAIGAGLLKHYKKL